jgi:diguanylate cyclase (GGDEF)-like protein/PAS domain S-box-containing protein
MPEEPGRLAALTTCGLLDSAPEPGFDHIVALACDLLRVPIATISLVDAERQWFKARVGIDKAETPRDISFCAHAILGDAAFVVPDARLDPRFAASPLVTGEPFARFYAGVPLRVDGHAIGTLCVIDRVPRDGLTDRQLRQLHDLAELARDRIEVARRERARAVGQGRFERMLSQSPTAAICADADDVIISWNAAATALFGHAASDAIGQPLYIIIPPRLRGSHAVGFGNAVASGRSRLNGKAVEICGIHRNGHEIPLEVSLSMWTEAGKPTFGALVRDISERHRAQEQLRRLALVDTLTGLPNRNALHQRLQVALAAEASRPESGAALMMLDLDDFKDVNDSLGHSAGDQLLVAAARRLAAAIGDRGYLGRLGGDEFAVLLPGCADPLAAGEVADDVIGAFKQPFEIGDQLVYVGTSIGIALYPAHGQDDESLFSRADLALYQAKADGGGARRFFVPAMQEASQARRRLSAELQGAFVDQEFTLLYQPQVRIGDGRIVGAEALLRWQHPRHGLLVPSIFLRVLESGPLAVLVGDWIIATACAQAARWRAEGLGPIRIGVNLFAAQVRDRRIVAAVRAALARNDLAAESLELEITENIVLREDDTIAAVLAELRDIGVGIAFDDFGTGFASLSMLKNYPLTKLKIDRSFVRHIDSDVGDSAIVEAVIGLAGTLGLGVIAEGIESAEQEAAVRRLGCDEGQGYHYGRPIAADAFAALLRADRPVGRDRGAGARSARRP